MGDFASRNTASCTANEPFLRIVTRSHNLVLASNYQKTVLLYIVESRLYVLVENKLAATSRDVFALPRMDFD